MTKRILKKLIRETIQEMGEPPGIDRIVLPPNTPAKPLSVGTETLAVSNFTTHKLEVIVKVVATGAIFVDIREA